MKIITTSQQAFYSEAARLVGKEHCKKYSTAKSNDGYMEDEPNVYSFARKDSLKVNNDFINSSASGATLVVAGAALGLRKREGCIELFEPHGETVFLQRHLNLTLNGTQKKHAYIVPFSQSQPEKMVAFINGLFPMLDGDGALLTQLREMRWYE